ncbi:unnamed protein product [Brassica napus]|uniref:(rape) hypothetical protein n=1 Tax=Brassica napus TaxID=3708 RepID=A0A817AMV2_BRANA|nr:unnamed protein product [Brassica napus]
MEMLRNIVPYIRPEVSELETKLSRFSLILSKKSMTWQQRCVLVAPHYVLTIKLHD